MNAEVDATVNQSLLGSTPFDDEGRDVGRRRPNSSAMRANTKTPFSWDGVTNVRYCGPRQYWREPG